VATIHKPAGNLHHIKTILSIAVEKQRNIYFIC